MHNVRRKYLVSKLIHTTYNYIAKLHVNAELHIILYTHVYIYILHVCTCINQCIKTIKVGEDNFDVQYCTALSSQLAAYSGSC